jgi:hypothetical protein
MPPIAFLFLLRRHLVELQTFLALVEHQALQLAMLVHRGANPLLVRRNEEMPPVLVAKRLIQRRALAGICGESDPSRRHPVSFARIPLSLLLDAKSPAWAGSDTFDLSVGFGISKGDA